MIADVLDHRNASMLDSESDSAFSVLITDIQRNLRDKNLLHPALAQLEQYDYDNHTDLLHTLTVYLDNDCNAQKCGRLLYLHRNSLVYRVKRIQEITGCDLSNPAERAYLRLSLLLRS